MTRLLKKCSSGCEYKIKTGTVGYMLVSRWSISYEYVQIIPPPKKKKSLEINVLQNFLGNLQTMKSEKSRFYSPKSGPEHTQTTVAKQSKAKQKKKPW